MFQIFLYESPDKVGADGDGGDSFFGCLAGYHGKLSFTMCNPPFFYREDNGAKKCPGGGERQRRPERPPRHPVPAGKEVEMRTEGGEVAFLTREEKSISIHFSLLFNL